MLIARLTTDALDLTLVERDEEFIVEALDLDADWRENVWAFKVFDNRQEAWQYYDLQASLYGNI